MTWQGWAQIVVFAALVTAAIYPLGGLIARVVEGRVWRPLAALESGLYRLAGVDPVKEQSWIGYALALLCFHVVGIVALYGLQRLQHLLPWFNPQALDAVAPELALNTASASPPTPVGSPMVGRRRFPISRRWRGSPYSPFSPVPLALPWQSRWYGALLAVPHKQLAISGSI